MQEKMLIIETRELVDMVNVSMMLAGVERLLAQQVNHEGSAILDIESLASIIQG